MAVRKSDIIEKSIKEAVATLEVEFDARLKKYDYEDPKPILIGTRVLHQEVKDLLAKKYVDWTIAFTVDKNGNNWAEFC